MFFNIILFCLKGYSETLSKLDAKNKTPPTSSMKQKQKCYWETKNVYLKEITFLTWDSVSTSMQK